MPASIQIRPICPNEVDQVIQLSREVQRDMAEEVVKHQLKFIIRHPWPYTITAVFAILIHMMTEWSIVQSTAVAIALALLEETVRFLVFFSKWVGIFQVGEDIIHVMEAFSAPKGQFLVAVKDCRIVGMVGAKETTKLGTGEITRFYIIKQYRQLGLGTRLLSAIKNELLSLGYSTVELLTHHSNSQALNFYHKHGFRLFNVIHYTSVYPYIYDQYELSNSLVDAVVQDRSDVLEYSSSDDEMEQLLS
ncbi:GNAT domain [Trinorchestia longiramus]|nr:GNAT domain [Trinorchestia longiramus]